MGLFSVDQMDAINKVAEQSKQVLSQPKSSKKASSVVDKLNEISKEVTEYFKDSNARLITTKEDLHNYITKFIEHGIGGIDTETTGLDRIHDTIVGASLYYPGEPEVYIPIKHLVPIFDVPYKNQLTYAEVGEEFQRLANGAVKLVFANADFDLAMIYKDLKVDLNKSCFFDVILAWRCLKENEKDNALKVLYNKYVLKGKGEPKKFSDFFPPELFPYCKPEVAGLYAANDAKITLELYEFEAKYLDKNSVKCQKNHLERISDLVYDIEMPLINVCQNMHRIGVYIDKNVAHVVQQRYHEIDLEERKKLSQMVDQVMEENSIRIKSSKVKQPFFNGKDFNPTSPVHTKYLVYTILNVPPDKHGETSTDKSVLSELNIPVVNQILKVRSIGVLINTFVEKMPNSTTPDSRIHARFNQLGARTGRLSSSEPNMQNIPSHAEDIRHLFRATPPMDKIVDCMQDDFGITAILGRYDRVYTPTGMKTVKDLSIGDDVILKFSNNMVSKVVSLNDVQSSPSLLSVVFSTVCDNIIYNIDIQTPAYVMLSSDYSAQEPRLTAFVSGDREMIKIFQEGRDIYGGIASLSFDLPYEKCLEFNPETGEYQPDGKARRNEAKRILLGITYGRAIPSIAEQLYGTRTDMTDDEKVKAAQNVYDSVLKAFPGIKAIMKHAKEFAHEHGYVETILGRRRHIPEMKLPEYEFSALKGYVNPDVDPLDITTLQNSSDIPERVKESLYKELKSYKYFGQVAARIKDLYENEHIRVTNNKKKIQDGERQCLNSIIQGSASDQSKMAMLMLENSDDWKRVCGRLLVPIHDELLVEVPMEAWEEGGKLLSSIMCEAANFLPFSSKCDVTTTLRWYGEEFPCKYPKPQTVDTVDQEEVKWLQWHFREMEYLLPVFKEPDGSKPKGDPAHGINGVITDEYKEIISNYIETRHIMRSEFIDFIDDEVLYGRDYAYQNNLKKRKELYL